MRGLLATLDSEQLTRHIQRRANNANERPAKAVLPTIPPAEGCSIAVFLCSIGLRPFPPLNAGNDHHGSARQQNRDGHLPRQRG